MVNRCAHYRPSSAALVALCADFQYSLITGSVFLSRNLLLRSVDCQACERAKIKLHIMRGLVVRFCLYRDIGYWSCQQVQVPHQQWRSESSCNINRATGKLINDLGGINLHVVVVIELQVQVVKTWPA